VTDGPLEHFACPVCGRLRPLGWLAARQIRSGSSSGECAPGHGCRAAIDDAERFRRFWLEHAGITTRQIRAAGGSLAYVLEFGVPGHLVEMASAFPEHAPITTRAQHALGRYGRPSGRHRRAAA
jgi:hypothetical protein